jgi:hypothetical protein
MKFLAIIYSDESMYASATPEQISAMFAAQEQLGGYYLLECKDLDEALSWAARIPEASFGAVEVRPVMDYDAMRAPEGAAAETA